MKYRSAITTTTRQPRQGEIEGQHYHFTTKEIFKEGLSNDLFVEHTEFSSNLYGLTKSEIEGYQETSILVMESDGFLNIQKYKEEKQKEGIEVKVQTIFFDIPKSILEQNMRKRGDNKEEIQKRLNETDEVSEKMNEIMSRREDNSDILHIKELLPLPEIKAKYDLFKENDLDILLFVGPSGSGKTMFKEYLLDLENK